MQILPPDCLSVGIIHIAVINRQLEALKLIIDMVDMVVMAGMFLMNPTE